MRLLKYRESERDLRVCILSKEEERERDREREKERKGLTTYFKHRKTNRKDKVREKDENYDSTRRVCILYKEEERERERERETWGVREKLGGKESVMGGRM